MKLNNGIEIRKEKATDNIVTNIFNPNTATYSPNQDIYQMLDRLYNQMCGMSNKEVIFDNWKANEEIAPYFENGVVIEEQPQIPTADQVRNGINGMIKFFSEFNFQPNFRFLNTLSRYGKKEGEGYIVRYFELINSPYTAVITEKMKSQEFKQIKNNFFAEQTTKQINNRFKLYYGSQGTGKTTQALQECNNACMVCHNAMLPADLLENFDFTDGKAEFQPSALYNAMVNGTAITLDEINLLPFESLRFLQGILDGKASFQYKDKTVNIADGFMIIGTMNLTVNGMTFGLPEPLVDRCAETRKFELTADNLLSAVL